MSEGTGASSNLDSLAPHVAGASVLSDGIVDWGPVPDAVEGESRTSGVLLHGDDRGAEAGIWICTPGLWRCHVERDEMCHFVAGRATYTHESGERVEVRPDTAAFFPAGWRGTCRVHETVRKVYMIR